MQVLVTVRNRSRSYAEVARALSLALEVDPEGLVGELVEQLSKRVGVPRESLQVILCGKVLSDATTLRSLLLGPQTSLAALVVDADVSLSESGAQGSEPAGPAESSRAPAGSFQVFCKQCDSPQRGKLRVYCGKCGSSSVIVKRDPTQWSDVLSASSIRADCKDCDEEVYAIFRFKCVKCAEVAVPLTQVRSAGGEGECCVCGETTPEAIVDLGCRHQTCVDCFAAYMATSFEQQLFAFRPPHGYTLCCPVYGCQGCVTDAHHFYLLGKKGYEVYQKQAAEKFVALQQNGLFCPNPDCGAAFFWEQEIDFFRVSCPECKNTFCTVCRRERCACRQEGDATAETIRATCRRCPSCGVPTERNGGCAHIHCLHCDAHWCFLCAKLWTEECQWDHWFA